MGKIYTQKLWQTTQMQQHEALLEQYCFAKDSILDNKLIIYDVWGSIAHASMLQTCGILTHTEFLKLKTALINILDLTKKHTFSVTETDEDVHTKIENFLIDHLGEVGKKIHTGRSRNDQVLTDLKLFTKDTSYALTYKLFTTIFAFLDMAKNYEFLAMPGYTHMQKAMPSSVGLWAESFAESLLDDANLVQTAYRYNDQSPLGSGASYGISLPTSREETATLLGFSKVQHNVLYTHNSRIKMHLSFMHALSQIMLTLSTFAQDILLFTTSEFNFFTLPQNFTTGSSIMPQKKNMDMCEIIHARTAIVVGHEQTVATIALGLPSGYNANFGQTKKLLFESIEIVEQTLPVITLLVQHIIPNRKQLEDACTPEIFATHKAFELVKKGTSFRQAHHTIANSLHMIEKHDPVTILKQTKQTGAPGKLELEKIIEQAKKQQLWWKKEQNTFTKAIELLLQKGGEKSAKTN